MHVLAMIDYVNGTSCGKSAQIPGKSCVESPEIHGFHGKSVVNHMQNGV